MDPIVESAWIAAAAAAVGVVGTATVAIVGFRISRSTNQATIDAAKANTDKTIAAAHADIHSTLGATHEGQFADRYSRAIEQLGSDNLDIRIGGIYALEAIGVDSARHHPAVMEVLTTFIRRHSREQWPVPESDADAPDRTTRPDVQAALTVVGRRNTTHDQRPIDLHGADLIRADLTGANLNHANLKDVKLTGANLNDADLTGVNLYGADLTDARLSDAELPDAVLTQAILPGAFLDNAKLPRAVLMGADLTGASLSLADLTEAIFLHTNLTNASLTRANLTGAEFSYADFTGADLTDVLLLDSPNPIATRAAPPGWVRDPGSGRLQRADAKS